MLQVGLLDKGTQDTLLHLQTQLKFGREIGQRLRSIKHVPGSLSGFFLSAMSLVSASHALHGHSPHQLTMRSVLKLWLNLQIALMQ
jgi:hypothetical protein